MGTQSFFIQGTAAIIFRNSMAYISWSNTQEKLSWMYRILLLARLVIALSFQGYVHPDEFFQSSEIAARDVLSMHVFTPWEFGGHKYTGAIATGQQLAQNVPCRCAVG